MLLRDRQNELTAAVQFRLATLADINGIADLLDQFFDDSDLPLLGLVYDFDAIRSWLARVITSGDHPHLIAVDGSEVVGSIDYSIDRSYTTQPIASLHRFYVRRKYRRTPIARALLTLALDLARGDGAVVFRAGLSSGKPGAQNLFFKVGFVPTPHSILLAKEL